MTQRDRPGPDSGSLPPASRSAAPLSGLMFAAGESSWEQWYRRATADERQQVLELAAQQTVLCSSQLPPSPPTPPARCLISEILAAGHLRGRLDPLRSAAISPEDVDLDETQRLAIARALETRDLCLIQGYPGSGKSRVVAEILRQADRRGLRVLFVAPGAALDGTLERLAGDPSLHVLRLLGADEKLETLPACVLRLSLAGRLRQYKEHTLATASRAAEQSAAALAARQADMARWERFSELLRLREQTQADLAKLDAQPACTPEVVAADLPKLALDAEGQQIHDRLAAVKRELEGLNEQLKQCDAQLQGLLPLTEAKQAGRWWTGAYWRAAFTGNVQPRVVELQQQCKCSADKHEALQREVEELTRRQQQHDELHGRERDEAIRQEVSRRLEERDRARSELVRRQEEFASSWQALCDGLSSGTQAPFALTADAIAAARDACQTQVQRDEQDAGERRRWLQALEQTQPGLAAHLTTSARIIAALPNGVPADATGFDLVVVEQAECLTDVELRALAPRGRACVLVGQPSLDLPIEPRRGSPRNRPNPKPAFERLWSALHPDPRRLTPRWFGGDGRLVARMRDLTPEQQRFLQREAVYDRPDIELVIHAPPRQEPRIVEVRFPASIALEDARGYIYREMDELAVEPAGACLNWREDEKSVTLAFGSASSNRMVVLGGGVREHLTAGEGIGWKTLALEFERAAGWDLAAARAWVEQRLGLVDHGRTTMLTRCHRAEPALARFLSDLLHQGAMDESAPRVGVLADQPAIEFVAVPSLNEGMRNDARRPAPNETRNGGGTAVLTPRLRSVRGGAGLETDLADPPVNDHRAPRRAEVLPQDLRPHLPPRGLINFLEARAVVAALEDLVSEPSFQSASRTWQQSRALQCAPSSPCGTHIPCPSVAVISLFPAQAALLRLLVQRSSVLSSAGVPVAVGLPEEFSQREALVAMVSLTRSHTHRAVPFSDSPSSLALTLTRAVARLVLFGDPGTLIRRSQWHGALDHHDETAGSTEQALIGKLLAALAGPETQERSRTDLSESWPARTRESSGV